MIRCARTTMLLALLDAFLQHCVAVAFITNQSTREYSPQTFEHIKPDHLQSLLIPLHAERDSDWDLHSTKQHKSTQNTQ